MKPSIDINIFSPRPLTEAHEGRAFFEMLNLYAPHLVPDRYDQIEPVKRPFSMDALDMVLEDWEKGFFWERKKPKSHGSAWPSWGPRAKHGGLRLTVQDYLQESDASMAFFKECSRYVEADFAALHLVTPGDIERGKANGTFSFNNAQRTRYTHLITTFTLEKYIPDLYWGTVLGRPYVELFGRERIKSSPAARIEELADGIFYLQLTEEIHDLETRYEDVEAVRRSIKQHLGENAFFNEMLGSDHEYRVPFFPLDGRNTNRHSPDADEGKGAVAQRNLQALFTHPNQSVRIWAATHTLEVSPAESENVLEEEAAGSGIVAFNARMILDQWRQGMLLVNHMRLRHGSYIRAGAILFDNPMFYEQHHGVHRHQHGNPSPSYVRCIH